MDNKRNIFVDGIAIDSIKDDQKLADFFEEFDDKIFRVADKKFAALCKKLDKKATLTFLVKFEEKE